MTAESPMDPSNSSTGRATEKSTSMKLPAGRSALQEELLPRRPPWCSADDGCSASARSARRCVRKQLPRRAAAHERHQPLTASRRLGSACAMALKDRPR